MEILPTPCNFWSCYCIETKFGTVIELCTFYRKPKELILFTYVNESYYVILLFQALKGIEFLTTVKSVFSNLLC